jgi:hypothetical protein
MLHYKYGIVMEPVDTRLLFFTVFTTYITTWRFCYEVTQVYTGRIKGSSRHQLL